MHCSSCWWSCGSCLAFIHEWLANNTALLQLDSWNRLDFSGLTTAFRHRCLCSLLMSFLEQFSGRFTI
jgi:hypothetical protein